MHHSQGIFSFFIESQQSSENPFYVRNIYIHCAKHDFSLPLFYFFVKIFELIELHTASLSI